jgi:uncharacterized iron-regulated protein
MFLTNEKKHLSDLSLMECIKEYQAMTVLYEEDYKIYRQLSLDDPLTKEYEEKLIYWFEERNTFAREIANRLTT